MLSTERLILRPFTQADAQDVQRLADDPGVSGPTAALPSPYLLSHAQAWIGSHEASAAQGRGRPWAIVRREDGQLLGEVSVAISPGDNLGTLGYWLGRAYWGHGYATEAVKVVVAWGFEQGLAKIAAEALATNAASIIVLQRSGLRLEGVRRKHLVRDGVRIAVHCFGRLREG